MTDEEPGDGAARRADVRRPDSFLGSAYRRLATAERRRAVGRVVIAAGLGLGALRAADLFLSHVLLTRNLYGEPIATSPE